MINGLVRNTTFVVVPLLYFPVGTEDKVVDPSYNKLVYPFGGVAPAGLYLIFFRHVIVYSLLLSNNSLLIFNTSFFITYSSFIFNFSNNLISLSDLSSSFSFSSNSKYYSF